MINYGSIENIVNELERYRIMTDSYLKDHSLIENNQKQVNDIIYRLKDINQISSLPREVKEYTSDMIIDLYLAIKPKVTA